MANYAQFFLFEPFSRILFKLLRGFFYFNETLLSEASLKFQGLSREVSGSFSRCKAVYLCKLKSLKREI
jgi:hypothetical protein